jgi:pimeloyl-ACP methyl ester carboxylesterase
MLDLVMIPALGCDRRLYEKIAPALADLVRPQTVIADRDSFAGCVQQVLEGAPESFVIYGTSFGGRVAMELTLAAPGRVKGLVVTGAGPRATPDLAVGLRRSSRIRGGEFDAVVIEHADIISHLPGPNGPSTREAFIAMSRAQGPDLMARQSDALAHRTDLRPRLGEISCPTLMLWGDHDQFTSAADGLNFSMMIPRARFVEIPECGHFPSLEYPEETIAALRHWLIDNGLT